MDFLIRRTDDEWFDWDNLPQALRPTSFESKVIDGWGNHRIEVEGVEIAFSDEYPGIQVIFENDIEPTLARQIVKEIAENITTTTDQGARIVEL